MSVTDAPGLKHALEAAQPGQTIRLADGHYSGHFVATAKATADKPIVLCGSRSVVIDGGDVTDGYTLHLMGASYWQLEGFTVTGGQKGIVLDAAQSNLIKGLLVTSVGDEAIHLRTASTDNLVTGNTIRQTGLLKPKYGEGVYVGTARSNWCQYSKCGPDHSDGNQIVGNDIAGTTAEPVDIKEGTGDGLVADNVFDGAAMTAAESWVNIKGNHWTIRNNRGTSSPGDGYSVHEILTGWGLNNLFAGNQASHIAGVIVNVAGSRAIRAATVVACTNRGDDPQRPVSNVPCTRI